MKRGKIKNLLKPYFRRAKSNNLVTMQVNGLVSIQLQHQTKTGEQYEMIH